MNFSLWNLSQTNVEVYHITLLYREDIIIVPKPHEIHLNIFLIKNLG